MLKKSENNLKDNWKLFKSYFSVTLSVSSVLFLLGFLGILLLNAHLLSNTFKEQVSIAIFLKKNAKDVDVEQLYKALTMASYNKSVTFVSKEEAARLYSEELGEDFINFIGDNPLLNSFDLRLKSNFVTIESIAQIAQTIQENPAVEEVSYDAPFVDKLNQRIQKTVLIGFIITAVIAIFSVILINTSIRLSIHSKRFIIKTMQLVGATKGFIRKPFLQTNFLLGAISSFIASGTLLLCIHKINNIIPEVQLLNNMSNLLGIFAFLFVVGVSLTCVCTYFATRKFLNLHTDELYL